VVEAKLKLLILCICCVNFLELDMCLDKEVVRLFSKLVYLREKERASI
jgi:hypothetical protein